MSNFLLICAFVAVAVTAELFDGHPFLGVPEEQRHLLDANGQLHLRLRQVHIPKDEATQYNRLKSQQRSHFLKEQAEEREYSPLYNNIDPVLVTREDTLKQAISKEYDIYWEGDNIYLIDLYLGSEAERHSFVHDTGSGWLTVKALGCNGCDSEHSFDFSQSATFQRDYPVFEVNYGSAST